MAKSSTKNNQLTDSETRQEYRRLMKTLERMNKSLSSINDKLDLVLNNASSNGGNDQSSKKKRDPNRPKKNKNGYLFFCQDKRDSVKTQHPNLDGKELVRILSKMWNDMSDKEKVPYQQRADKDKKRYHQEMEKYNNQPTPTPAVAT
jgi:high mobility group protein B3